GESHRVLYYWHSVANKALTMLSNWFTNLNLTDMETCYKVFKREIIQNMKLRSNRFGFEPEVTAKIARRRKGQPRYRVFEVPISYPGRTYEEGKKIKLKDAFQALYCIVRYGIADYPVWRASSREADGRNTHRRLHGSTLAKNRLTASRTASGRVS